MQQWSARRLVVWLGLVVAIVILAVNAATWFSNADAYRTPLDVNGLSCTGGALEPLWLEAQSVQAAAFVPCVASLPVGWSFGRADANSGRSSFTVNHDRAGNGALEVIA